MSAKNQEFYQDLMRGPIPDAPITGGQLAYLRRHPDDYPDVLNGMEAVLTAARVKAFASRIFREGGAPISKAHANELLHFLTSGAEAAK